MHTEIPIIQTLNSAPPRTISCGRWNTDNKYRFWYFSKPDPDLVQDGHHLGVILWGGLHAGVRCLFYPRGLAQPNRWILEKLVERLAYTRPLDTVNPLGVYEL